MEIGREEMIREIESSNLSVKRSSIVYKHMRDPALLSYYYKVKMMPINERLDLSGSSPTDIFIGRNNYPNVYIGPMLPPEFGDTSILSTPERWKSFSIPKIVEMRSKLVRGIYKSKVYNVEKGRMEEQVRDLALAERPAEAEVKFAKKLFITLSLRDEVQPFGPSAALRSFDVYNIKADRKIESMYNDGDARASTAVVELYEKGIPVSKIQQSFSAGLFGISAKRRFVPTRWSITAVDDTIAKSNLDEVKDYESIDTIHAYYNVSLDNRWLILFIPGKWQYESSEAWYPKTIWNENGTDVSIYSSYEGYKGRKTYAEIGGCYYAAKLAVTEKLKSMKKQAMVLILREVHEGYIMPVGVWNVREHVRETLGTAPIILNGRQDIFNIIKEKMEIRPKDWIMNCRILRDIISQRGINDYIAKA
jgi:hypothetical protein